MEYADVLVNRDGSIKVISLHIVDCSPVLHDIECLSHVNSCVHHCDKIHILGRSYGTVSLMKNATLKAYAFAVPPQCKRKMILSGAH